MSKLNISKNLQNNIVVVGIIAVLIIVLFGVSQVVLKNLRGDKANATVGSTYLAQIGVSAVDPNPNGAFDDSKKICQTVDGSCVEDGLIDYEFTSVVEKANLTEAFDPNVANSTRGGLILTKENNVFNQNGTVTSKNYVPKAGKNVSITKIQIGVGLKPENLISMGYSLDSGANFNTAIGNFTYDQLKAQENQTVIEYSFPNATQVSQGFAYKIALKADSTSKKSPSLKFVRVFYTVTSGSSSTSGSTTSSSSSSSGDLPRDNTTTRISARNIGDGSCTPATIGVGATTTCTWRLVDGPAGTVYYINSLPSDQPVTGAVMLVGALIHSEATSSAVTSLSGVKSPSEFNNFQTDNTSQGTCSVSYDNLICANISANGNLTAGNKFVDIVFHGSTPPIAGQNDLYGNPGITLNKARITLTAGSSSSSSSGGSTTSTSGSTSSTSTSGSTSSSSTSGSTTSTSTSGSTSSSTSGSTTSSSTSGSTTSTSTSGTPFLPLPSSSTSGTVPTN